MKELFLNTKSSDNFLILSPIQFPSVLEKLGMEQNNDHLA